MEHGFIRVAAAIPSVRVADVDYNLTAIEQQILEAENKNVEIIVFPELSITGYTCQDLFQQQALIKKAEAAVVSLADFSKDKQIVIIVGLPVDTGKLLLNCAAVVSQGKLISLVPKTYLPNYGEFYEKRWFASSQDLSDDECFIFAGCHISNMKSSSTIFETPSGIRFGIEICEDLWAPTPPSNHLSLAGADLIFNLSATDEMIGKHDYLTNLISQQSARTISGYIYSSCGFGESTQDVVYGGNAFVFENGSLLAESERFSFNPQLIISEIDIERLRYDRRRNTTFTNAQRSEKCKMLCHTGSADTGQNSSQFSGLVYRKVNPYPFIPQAGNLDNSCDEILNIQIAGLAKRLVHTNCKKVVVGISGGLDSTLALLVCVKTFDKLSVGRKNIIGVTMPGFGTTDRTYTNAVNLMKSLGITIREISIVESVVQHFKDIDHDISQHDVTYENSQARERTQILMDLANKLNAMVIGTGDMSELALGWATYNGDHMSMYGVNAGIPKTLIKHLVRFVADHGVDSDSKATLLDIIDTPISPELIPANADGTINQRTEDLVGPYDLHDFFLYYMLRFGYKPSKIKFLAQKAFEGMFSDEIIDKWLETFCRRFFSQQFKRSCLPDGPKVGSISLSPRGDWRMPSDASSCLWLSDCER